MRTFGVLLRAHLRGRRLCTPELSRLLVSGTFVLKPDGVSRSNYGVQGGHDHLGHAQIFCTDFRRSYSASRSGHDRNTGEWITYDPQAFSQYYKYRPLQVAHRAIILISEVVLLSIGHVVEKDILKRAEKLKQALVRLGPFYVKLGQALSTRPDILPSEYCQELAKLQDHVPPYPTSVALEFLESELGLPASELYADITPEPVAAASLGQVYKARLHSGELVAVKVQRPGVTGRLALDAHLLGLLGGPLQRFAGARSDLIAMINEMVERMFEEIDYVREGRYAERFNKLYGTVEDDVAKVEDWHGMKRINVKLTESSMEGMVKVPKVYWDLTSRGVLTMEWVDGLKLTDKEGLRAANLDTQALVEQGVFCSLRQLLEEGFFHADPHPGNLVVTKEGVLAYFDFGMMSEFPKEYRIGLMRTIVHFVNRDSLGLAEDFIVLGFIPKDTELTPIAEALAQTFELEGTIRRLDFQGIMAQLSEVMYQFKFRLPPEYAMVIRALGSLEGTATILDPDFKVVASAYPFVVGRLLADPDPAMREILRELLIRSNGSIRWHRLERLVFAIAEQSTSTNTEVKAWRGHDGLGRKAAAGIRGAFNTRSMASATMDVFIYILSEKGVRVRTLLVQDLTQVFDRFLLQSIAQMLDVNKDFEDNSTKTAGQGLQGSVTAAAISQEQVHTQDAPNRQKYQPFHWSHFTSASLWGWTAGRKVLETDSWQNITNEKQTHYVGGVDNISSVTVSAEKRSTDRGQGSGSERAKGGASSDGPSVDEFTNRFKVGFQAFANAVNSSPEIWIPLMTRLASTPEARSLGVAITSSLFDVYCGRTSEASFVMMSNSLRKHHINELRRQKKQDSSENKV